MLIEPKIRGFICTTSHPIGCEAHVKEQIQYALKHPIPIAKPQRILVIGCSTGYGLATRIISTFSAQAPTLGICFEKSATLPQKTASPGWYNTAAFEKFALQKGYYAKTLNGDAFSMKMKEEAIALIQKDWGEVDVIVYSLASPRRQDPFTNTLYSSVLKPIGQPFTGKTVDIMSGKVSTITLEPASETEIEHTIQVMGGYDWALWIKALQEADVLAPHSTTFAYSYIGPQMTYPIYRQGTIGKAKEHLEATAIELDTLLKEHCQGKARIAVNKAVVTQASAAIPVVPLYISALYKVMKKYHCHETCIEQISRLFHLHLYPDSKMHVEIANPIRLDDYEMREDVQAEIAQIWPIINSENIEEYTDIQGYRKDFYKLFGFGLDMVNYAQEVDIDIPIPSISTI